MSDFVLPLTVIGVAAVALIVLNKPISQVLELPVTVYDDTKQGIEGLACSLRNDDRNCVEYDAHGGSMIAFDEGDPSNFPGPKALGSRCDITADCSASGVYEGQSGVPANGTNHECRRNICSRVNLITGDDLQNQGTNLPGVNNNPTLALGSRCNLTSQCSGDELRNGPVAVGDNVECRNNFCNRVSLI